MFIWCIPSAGNLQGVDPLLSIALQPAAPGRCALCLQEALESPIHCSGGHLCRPGGLGTPGQDLRAEEEVQVQVNQQQAHLCRVSWSCLDSVPLAAEAVVMGCTGSQRGTKKPGRICLLQNQCPHHSSNESIAKVCPLQPSMRSCLMDAGSNAVLLLLCMCQLSGLPVSCKVSAGCLRLPW